MPTNHKRHNSAPRGSASELTAATDQPVTATETPAGDPAPPPQPPAAQQAPRAPQQPPGQQSHANAGAALGAPAPPRRGEGLNIGELKEMSIQKLTQIAKELN